MELSMSEFVDFHVLTGSSRVAKVRSLKNRGDYDPATDFWRPLRKAISAYHRRAEGDTRGLRDFLPTVTERRVGRYDAAIRGHTQFIRNKAIRGLAAPSAWWEVGQLRVRVNPEIALRIEDRRYVVKLYFKSEPLSRGRAQALIALMEEELRSSVAASTQFAVWDVPNAHLRVADGRSSIEDTQIALHSEAGALVEIWESI
jgi:hypothetical protein